MSDSEQLVPRSLLTRLLRREKEFEAARRVTEAVGQKSDIDEILTGAVSVAVEVVGGRAGSVMLADEERQLLVFRVSVGDNPVKPGTSLPWTQGIAGEVFRTGESRIVHDIAVDERHYDAIDAMTGFKTLNMFALPLKGRDGKIFGVMEVLNKPRDPQDEDLAVLTVISQLTSLALEQARLNEEARIAALAHRLREVSHDLKNMLIPVTLGVDMLHQELVRRAPEEVLAPGSELRDAVQMVKDAVVRIQSRVRIISDQMRGRPVDAALERCVLADLVDEVLASLRLVAGERRVRLRSEGMEAIPPFQADASRLFTALYNLVDNAIPATPPDGSVTLRARLAGEGFVQVEVEDTGAGMPPEVRDNLFSGRIRSQKRGGTGLGTKIVHDVVVAHGGRISVRSALGQGTCFTILLPIIAGNG